MNIPIQDEADIKELKYEKSSGSIEGTETNEETSLPLKDRTLTMIVLLLACLALAALAHIIV